MPKRYSDEEKAYIVRRLKEEAAKCLDQYVIRRTTVDELVGRVKIPKGTFYLFFPSKELLFFQVILELHHKLETQLLDTVSGLDRERLTPEALADVFFQFFKTAEKMPILKMIHSDEVELLARRLPRDVLEEHLNQDHSIVERLFSALAVDSDKDTAVYSAAFRELFFATLHKEELEDKHYDEALKLLLRGLAIQLLQ